MFKKHYSNLASFCHLPGGGDARARKSVAPSSRRLNRSSLIVASLLFVANVAAANDRPIMVDSPAHDVPVDQGQEIQVPMGVIAMDKGLLGIANQYGIRNQIARSIKRDLPKIAGFLDSGVGGVLYEVRTGVTRSEFSLPKLEGGKAFYRGPGSTMEDAYLSHLVADRGEFRADLWGDSFLRTPGWDELLFVKKGQDGKVVVTRSAIGAEPVRKKALLTYSDKAALSAAMTAAQTRMFQDIGSNIKARLRDQKARDELSRMLRDRQEAIDTAARIQKDLDRAISEAKKSNQTAAMFGTMSSVFSLSAAVSDLNDELSKKGEPLIPESATKEEVGQLLSERSEKNDEVVRDTTEARDAALENMEQMHSEVLRTFQKYKVEESVIKINSELTYYED